jgi:hypothetical protein
LNSVSVLLLAFETSIGRVLSSVNLLAIFRFLSSLEFGFALFVSKYFEFEYSLKINNEFII